MGKRNNPSWFSKKGGGKDKVKEFSEEQLDQFPVETVSWDETQDFLKRPNAQDEENKNKREYRLPSEAEWEYACRGGAANKRYHFGDRLSTKQANFEDSKLGRTTKVGSYPANAFGLHDMHGNVWEWCSDWYAQKYDANSPKCDPLCLEEALGRADRGGSWSHSAKSCRSASRAMGFPSNRNDVLGFRVALVPTR